MKVPSSSRKKSYVQQVAKRDTTDLKSRIQATPALPRELGEALNAVLLKKPSFRKTLFKIADSSAKPTTKAKIVILRTHIARICLSRHPQFAFKLLVIIDDHLSQYKETDKAFCIEPDELHGVFGRYSNSEKAEKWRKQALANIIVSYIPDGAEDRVAKDCRDALFTQLDLPNYDFSVYSEKLNASQSAQAIASLFDFYVILSTLELQTNSVESASLPGREAADQEVVNKMHQLISAMKTKIDEKYPDFQINLASYYRLGGRSINLTSGQRHSSAEEVAEQKPTPPASPKSTRQKSLTAQAFSRLQESHSADFQRQSITVISKESIPRIVPQLEQSEQKVFFRQDSTVLQTAPQLVEQQQMVHRRQSTLAAIQESIIQKELEKIEEQEELPTEIAQEEALSEAFRESFSQGSDVLGSASDDLLLDEESSELFERGKDENEWELAYLYVVVVSCFLPKTLAEKLNKAIAESVFFDSDFKFKINHNTVTIEDIIIARMYLAAIVAFYERKDILEFIQYCLETIDAALVKERLLFSCYFNSEALSYFNLDLMDFTDGKSELAFDKIIQSYIAFLKPSIVNSVVINTINHSRHKLSHNPTIDRKYHYLFVQNVYCILKAYQNIKKEYSFRVKVDGVIQVLENSYRAIQSEYIIAAKNYPRLFCFIQQCAVPEELANDLNECLDDYRKKLPNASRKLALKRQGSVPVRGSEAKREEPRRHTVILESLTGIFAERTYQLPSDIEFKNIGEQSLTFGDILAIRAKLIVLGARKFPNIISILHNVIDEYLFRKYAEFPRIIEWLIVPEKLQIMQQNFEIGFTFIACSYFGLMDKDNSLPEIQKIQPLFADLMENQFIKNFAELQNSVLKFEARQREWSKRSFPKKRLYFFISLIFSLEKFFSQPGRTLPVLLIKTKNALAQSQFCWDRIQGLEKAWPRFVEEYRKSSVGSVVQRRSSSRENSSDRESKLLVAPGPIDSGTPSAISRLSRSKSVGANSSELFAQPVNFIDDEEKMSVASAPIDGWVPSSVSRNFRSKSVGAKPSGPLTQQIDSVGSESKQSIVPSTVDDEISPIVSKASPPDFKIACFSYNCANKTLTKAVLAQIENLNNSFVNHLPNMIFVAGQESNGPSSRRHPLGQPLSKIFLEFLQRENQAFKHYRAVPLKSMITMTNYCSAAFVQLGVIIAPDVYVLSAEAESYRDANPNKGGICGHLIVTKDQPKEKDRHVTRIGVASVHFSKNGHDTRRKELEVIVRDLSARPLDMCIVMGDFNEGRVNINKGEGDGSIGAKDYQSCWPHRRRGSSEYKPLISNQENRLKQPKSYGSQGDHSIRDRNITLECVAENERNPKGSIFDEYYFEKEFDNDDTHLTYADPKRPHVGILDRVYFWKNPENTCFRANKFCVYKINSAVSESFSDHQPVAAFFELSSNKKDKKKYPTFFAGKTKLSKQNVLHHIYYEPIHIAGMRDQNYKDWVLSTLNGPFLATSLKVFFSLFGASVFYFLAPQSTLVGALSIIAPFAFNIRAWLSEDLNRQGNFSSGKIGHYIVLIGSLILAIPNACIAGQYATIWLQAQKKINTKAGLELARAVLGIAAIVPGMMQISLGFEGFMNEVEILYKGGLDWYSENRLKKKTGENVPYHGSPIVKHSSESGSWTKMGVTAKVVGIGLAIGILIMMSLDVGPFGGWALSIYNKMVEMSLPEPGKNQGWWKQAGDSSYVFMGISSVFFIFREFKAAFGFTEDRSKWTGLISIAVTAGLAILDYFMGNERATASATPQWKNALPPAIQEAEKLEKMFGTVGVGLSAIVQADFTRRLTYDPHFNAYQQKFSSENKAAESSDSPIMDVVREWCSWMVGFVIKRCPECRHPNPGQHSSTCSKSLYPGLQKVGRLN